MKNQFWEIVIDDKNRVFEIIGTTTNDTLLINNTCALQREGFKVRCQALDLSTHRSEIVIQGYKEEKGVYESFLNQYEQKTGKALKKW